MGSAPDDQAAIAAVERHLREGEAQLARLEETVAELARHDPAGAALLAARTLDPLRHSVDLVRDRLAAVKDRLAAARPVPGDDAPG